MWKWVAIGLGIIVTLLIAFIIGLYLAPQNVRESIRDIFIVILAVFQLVSVVLLTVVFIAVLYAINQLNSLARGSVLPKLDEAMLKMNEVLDSTRVIASDARDSVSTVSGSTSFVAEHVVSPIIRVSSLFTGVRAAATSLARRDAPERMEQEL